MKPFSFTAVITRRLFIRCVEAIIVPVSGSISGLERHYVWSFRNKLEHPRGEVVSKWSRQA
jgi:hypothetical protein